ncbi:hypothetical protein EV702DRAFT_1046820 [Suillus placidus]|uniref:DUF6532 domain-containing protein n=1 Tax=Suillus placidus TaxID=48579 RepID=A0A9P7D0Y1_9AGAM|nr:hypothetical protein EV702DRAFT_1046820 [Suillus placidus]
MLLCPGRSIFIPTVIHWLRNSTYPWTIPEDKFSDVLADISRAVYSNPGNFQYDDGLNLAYHIVSQRVHEWRGHFGSTAISILMTFFSSTNEFKTKEARKAYAKYQLKDSRFVYEDPDNEDSPGAFLSEFILRVFTVQLNATQGHQIIDSLHWELPTYSTALALTTTAAEHALILACNNLIVEDNLDQGKHKFMLMLNHATNKMTNTGTAFSSANWETDTIAYMQQIEELPFNRLKEIIQRSQRYMKHSPHKGLDELEDDDGSQNFVGYYMRACLPASNH